LSHTGHVCDELAAVVGSLGDPIRAWSQPLADAARWHDAGKGHEVFQHGVQKANPSLDQSVRWAKSGAKGRLWYARPHFRHELGSALAVLKAHPEWPFVVAYLIAAHHGKVRLSIRALPGEVPPDDASVRFALGVRDGDELPEVGLGGGAVCPATRLDLSPMQLGGEGSWTGRALALLAELGPFKLGYLEAVLRAADMRASQKEAGRA
jgi:CRISPR-associated endonuclease/helicase Cas3